MTSPLNAGLELCRRLVEADHRVTVVGSAEVAEVVEAHGFTFRAVTADRDFRDAAATVSTANPVAWGRTMRRLRSDSVANDEIEQLVVQLDPDMLIIDIEMHYAIIATAHLDIPTVTTMNLFSVFRSPGLPPLNVKLQPGDDVDTTQIDRAWARVRVEAAAARLRHKMSTGALGDVLRPVMYDTIQYADLKSVARNRDFDLRANTDRTQWLRPYMYTQIPVLCLNAVELEFPHEPHPNLRYVGPMVNRNRPEPRVDHASLRQWETYKATRAQGDGTRPLIYCSLGSYASNPSRLRGILAAVSRRPDWDLVLGLGGRVRIDDLGPIPSNALLLDWAPQLEVLALADCSINHGGITSVNESIASGVPMVVYSLSQTDQDGNAARVAYHGLGVSAEWGDHRPEQVERHINEVLTSDEMRRNVHSMRRVFDRYEANGVAVSVIMQELAVATSAP